MDWAESDRPTADNPQTRPSAGVGADEAPCLCSNLFEPRGVTSGFTAVLYPQSILGGGRSSDAKRMSLEGDHRFQPGPVCIRCATQLWLVYQGDAPEDVFERLFGFTFVDNYTG